MVLVMREVINVIQEKEEEEEDGAEGRWIILDDYDLPPLISDDEAEVRDRIVPNPAEEEEEEEQKEQEEERIHLVLPDFLGERRQEEEDGWVVEGVDLQEVFYRVMNGFRL